MALDRWSEPLASNITSVFAENLPALIAPDTVMPYSWTFSRKAEIIVSVQVVTFGPDASVGVVLNVLLRIIGYCRETVGLKKHTIPKPG